MGYAFVNLVDRNAVELLWRSSKKGEKAKGIGEKDEKGCFFRSKRNFHGYSDWTLPTAKVCEVSWSGPHQGFKAHVERYRNSPVMHKSVPDHYKPVIFKNGVRKTFPKPTKKVKAPF